MGSSVKFSHNKKRNTGLVYEFLVRKMSESLLENDSTSYKKALKLLKKYYFANSPLDEEKQLFDTIINTENVSERVASGILKEVMSSARKLNFKYLDIKKSNLLKEVHQLFGKNFFSDYRFDNYKAYASVQLLINGCSPKASLNEGVQRVQLEEALMKYMMRDTSIKEQELAVDNLAYKIAVKKFNERYSDTLSESQKSILRSYMMSFTSEAKAKKFSAYLGKEKNKILKYLKNSHHRNEISADSLMLEKLKDAELILEKLDVTTPNAETVEDIMLYCHLAEEIASNE